MPSQSRDTRENQMKAYDQRLQERRADLEKKGVTPKDIARDSVYAHLMAKRRGIINAITVIDALAVRNVHHEKAPKEEVAAEAAPPKVKKPKKVKAIPGKSGH